MLPMKAALEQRVSDLLIKVDKGKAAIAKAKKALNDAEAESELAKEEARKENLELMAIKTQQGFELLRQERVRADCIDFRTC